MPWHRKFYKFSPEITKGRVCSCCKEWKSSENFHKSTHDKSGLKSYCKDCHRKYYREYNSKITAHGLRRGTLIHIRNRYGLKGDEYSALLSRKSCEICGEDKTLVIDHDHETDEVRGVLCRLCNIIVGMLETHPEKIVSAKKYLETHATVSRTA